MGRPKKLNEDHIEFIKANAAKLSLSEIADAIGLGERTIRNCIKENKIKRKLVKPMGPRRFEKAKEGFFNVMERMNWLV